MALPSSLRTWDVFVLFERARWRHYTSRLVGNAIWPTKDASCVRFSPSLYLIFSSVRATDIMDRYHGVLLDTSTWRGESPRDQSYEAARFNELGNMYFVGHIALHTSLHSHVATHVGEKVI